MSGLLYTWLGDDFTGSTDVLEVLAEAGVPALLLLREPADEVLRRFPGLRAIGLASDARSRSPGWMDDHLPAQFEHLARLSPAILHYKTCSTFDSAPDRGSIGHALDLGMARFGGPVPIVVGAPDLGRYLLFGTLFAAGGGQVWRLDRHPTMARHPATPMAEADLRRHLARQTEMPVAAITLPQLQAGDAPRLLAAADPRGAVMIDGVDQASLALAGAAMWGLAGARAAGPLFAAGSSGLTGALIAAWRQLGLLPMAGCAPMPPPLPVDRLFVVSGSCSPATAAQIEHALAHGYAGIHLPPEATAAQVDQAIATATRALKAGHSSILYTARGPLPEQARAPQGDRLGRALGDIITSVARQTGIRRVLLAGGDTSSHAVAQLGLDALTWAGRLERGAPLCRAHGHRHPLDGIELVLKGGQIGAADFCDKVRRGGQAQA